MDKGSRIIKKRSARKFTWLLAACFLILIQAGLTFTIHELLENNTPGMDFYTFWVAGRAVENKISPYGDEVALESQFAVLKRPARPDEDQMGFAYPLYALFPVFPTTHFTFEWAQPFWLAFNLIVLSSSLFLAFPKSPIRVLIFTLPFYPLTFALILGNYNILVSAIILTSIALLVFQKRREKSIQILIGLILAWTTIKPQFSWLYLLFIILYALKQKLYPFLFSFLLAFIGYFLLSFLIYPAWINEWIVRLRNYSTYINTNPVLLNLVSAIFKQNVATTFFIVLSGSSALLTIWMFYKNSQNHLWSLQLIAWIGLWSYLLGPRSVSYEQLRFFIPFIFWIGFSNRKKYAWWFFGIGTIVLSWVVFITMRFSNSTYAYEEIRLLFHLAWLIYFFLQSMNNGYSKGNQIEPQSISTLAST